MRALVLEDILKPAAVLCAFLALFTACCRNAEPESSFPDRQISDPHLKATVSLQKLENLPGYRLRVRSGDRYDDLHLKDHVYRLETADIDHDGKTDILLGLTKKTHFEPVMEKRLQALRIDAGKLRPLWLGSRLCARLIDFRPVRHNDSCRILTLEERSPGRYAVGLYQWQDFGLRLIRYENNNSVYSDAQKHFTHEKIP